MLTGLKFFIPAIYFDVHKKCNDGQVQLDGVPGALTARGNQHVNRPTLRAHALTVGLVVRWHGSCRSSAARRRVPRPLLFHRLRWTCTQSVGADIFNLQNKHQRAAAALPAQDAALGLLLSPSFAQAGWVSSALDGRPVVTLLNLLARVVAEF